MEITVQGNVDSLNENRAQKLAAMLALLKQIETKIRTNFTAFEGTRNFKGKYVREVFEDKSLNVDTKKATDAQFEHFVSSKEWIASSRKILLALKKLILYFLSPFSRQRVNQNQTNSKTQVSFGDYRFSSVALLMSDLRQLDDEIA